MSLSALPTEIILCIVATVSQKDVNALVRVNRRLYSVLGGYLYRCDVLHSNGSALSWAAEKGIMATFQKALNAGAELPTVQPIGKLVKGKQRWIYGKWTTHIFSIFNPHPLSVAAKGGHESIVKFIIARGASPDMIDPEGYTLLSLAAIHGHKSLVTTLLQLGARLDLDSFSGHRPLELAATQGHREVMDIILTELERGPDETLVEQMLDALQGATVSGHESIVKLLLDRGVKLDLLSKATYPPLTVAADLGDETLVTLFLENGADANPIRIQSESALMKAVENGHEAIVKRLVPETNRLHATKALSSAVYRLNERMVKVLLSNGVCPNFYESDFPEFLQEEEVEDEFRQPLVHAVDCGSRRLVELLVDHGADVNIVLKSFPWMAQDVRRTSIIQLAVYRGYDDIVDFLVNRGADPKVANDIGQSAVLC